MPTQLTIVEWNVHWGVTRVPDRPRNVRFDPLDVLGDDLLRRADVVVFPESFRYDDGSSFLDGCERFGLDHVVDTDYCRLNLHDGRRYLNSTTDGMWKLAVATRQPIIEAFEIPLARTWRDPVPRRHALVVRIDTPSGPVDIVAFHVSSKVWFGAPVVQLRSLVTALRDRQIDGSLRPAIIAGDGNIWRAWMRWIAPGWRSTARGASFPSWRPHSQIDHICIRGALDEVDSEVLSHSEASDHRALVTRLQLR